MRDRLIALRSELVRLKANGQATVSVAEASIESLRAAIGRKSTIAPTQKPTEPSQSAAPIAGPVVVLPRKEPASSKPFAAPPTVTLPAGGKTEKWESLKQQVLRDPVCVANVFPGKKLVLGVGSLNAKIMFVGEAPGAEEEEQGEPFVGRAGELLTKMISGMGLARGDVYIANIMNWRPSLDRSADGNQVGNRPPTPEEMAYCMPFLRAQIDVVQPNILVALGGSAASGLLGPGAFKALGEIRGQWREFGGKPVMVTYHPSYILRNGSNRSKRMIWEDLLLVMERAGLPLSEKQRNYFL